MDYEKKYKEMKARVLEIGRGYVNGVDFSKPRQIAEYIDPDLKESEDERIRKGLIEHLKELKEQSVEGSHLKRPEYYDTWIAWLEKKLLNNEEYQTVPVETLDRLYAAEKELERLKQCEKKTEKWSFPYAKNETVDKLIAIAECLEMDGDCLFNGYTGTECGKFLRDLARKQVECKSIEWSEEDIRNIQDIDSILFYDRRLTEETCMRLRNFLESLKNRVQQKQEWSEEDKMHLKNAILAAEKEWGVDSFTAKWLKSLYPKHITYELDAPLSYDKDMNPIYPPINYWKPTGEQMQALFDASERNDKLGFVLRNLYDNLRKL